MPNDNKTINEYFQTGYKWLLGIFADLVTQNRKDTDKIVKAIDAKHNGDVVSGLDKVATAIKQKEITKKVEITNPKDIGDGIIDKLGEVVDTLKSEIIKIDKNVVIKNDLSSLAALFKGNNDKKDVINALDAIFAQIKAVGNKDVADYTLALDDIATILEGIKIPEVKLTKIEKLLEEIKDKETSMVDIPNHLSEYDEKGRLKVVLSDKQLAKMGGSAVALQNGSSGLVKNTSGAVVNPATEETQTAIAGLVTDGFDYLSLSYTGSDITGIVYKTGGASGTTVATLTLGYTDDNLVSITKS